MDEKSPEKKEPLMVTATFYTAEGKLDHVYDLDMDDKQSRVRFAIECERAHRHGCSVRTDPLAVSKSPDLQMRYARRPRPAPRQN